MPRVTVRFKEELTRARARLEEADGLWDYWRSHDITRTDDEWADFTDAVYAHLDGKPVPSRFLERPAQPPKAKPRKVKPPKGCVQAVLDTQAYIRECLVAGDKLQAIRKVVDEYNRSDNQALGAPTAMAKIMALLTTVDAPWDHLDIREVGVAAPQDGADQARGEIGSR